MDNYAEVCRQMNKQIDKALKADGQNPKEIKVICSPESIPCEKCGCSCKENYRNNLAEIAAKGKVMLFAKADEFWGGEKAKDYYSPVLKNPTWLDVAVHANKMINVTLDEHHVFLESITYKKTKAGIKYYEFSMGS